MTSPPDAPFDTIHKKLDKIARLQHVHSRRLEDKTERDLRVPHRLHDMDKVLEQIIGRLDLLEDAHNTHGAKLDAHGDRLQEIVTLLRTD
jgi:hypothetical protein